MSETKLLHGDCYDIIPAFPDKSIDLVLTDPPYQFGSIHGSGMFSEKNYAKYGRTRNINMLRNLEKLDSVVFEPTKLLDMLEPKLRSFYGYFFCNKALVADYINWANRKKYSFDILAMVKCLSGTTEIWCKNLKGEIFKSALKDLYRHTNVNSVQVYNGTKWVNISSITKTQRTTGLILKLWNGSYICCTHEHKFFVNGEEVVAKKLKEGMILDGGKLNFEEKELPMISDNLAWFIGYFIANGSYSKTKIEIATNKEKEFVLERIKGLCKEYNAKWYLFDVPNTKRRTIFVCSPIIRGALEEYISGKLAYGKHLSSKAFNTNKNFLNHVLLGYLEGDSYIDKKLNCYSLNFTRKNVELKNDLISICNILNYHSTFKKYHATLNGKKFATWTGRIYCREVDNHFWKSDFEIKEIIQENHKHDFYDLSIDDKSHRFMLTDGILTHNCNPIPAHSTHHLCDIEYIILIRDKGTYFQGKGLELDNYRKWYQTICTKRIHPAEKPVELLERFVRVSCPKGGLVFDPFAGSGSTAIACLNNGRSFMGVEKDNSYFDLASRRIKEREDELNGVGTLFEGIE